MTYFELWSRSRENPPTFQPERIPTARMDQASAHEAKFAYASADREVFVVERNEDGTFVEPPADDVAAAIADQPAPIEKPKPVTLTPNDAHGNAQVDVPAGQQPVGVTIAPQEQAGSENAAVDAPKTDVDVVVDSLTKSMHSGTEDVHEVAKEVIAALDGFRASHAAA